MDVCLREGTVGHDEKCPKLAVVNVLLNKSGLGSLSASVMDMNDAQATERKRLPAVLPVNELAMFWTSFRRANSCVDIRLLKIDCEAASTFTHIAQQPRMYSPPGAEAPLSFKLLASFSSVSTSIFKLPTLIGPTSEL